MMKIQEIRDYLCEHPQYFSEQNNIEIIDIKSQYKYYFIADCGHEFLSYPCNAFRTGKLSCPFCTGRRVLKGFNDMWTTHPELASRLLNHEDGYKYSIGSNVKLAWLCQNCGRISYKTPNKMFYSRSYCQECNKTNSYGEKFMVALLTQLCEGFQKEKIFDWSKSKKYDFYLPYYQCIIEIHGKQHYSKSDFSKLGGKSYIEEQINDQDKKELALQNGIREYIVIENIKSEKEILKNNILNSLLPTIIGFSDYDIDWDACHEFCLTSTTKLICDYYELVDKDLDRIAEIFSCCHNTVKKHLKDGAAIGLCTYSPEQSKKLGIKKSISKMITDRSKPVLQLSIEDENVINEYKSIQDAQRDLKISHIWDCLVGRRNTAGGYKWKYKEV